MRGRTSGRLLTVVRVLGELAAQEAGRVPARTGQAGTEADGCSSGVADGFVSAGALRRARAARAALERLGPLYVKVGQVLATRPDMVPAHVRAEFQKLNDRVPAQPFATFAPVLEANLGPRWERMFDDVDVTSPLGAASLAQVHRVTLRGGAPGVVKIQRPGIRGVVRADMALLRRAAWLTARGAPRFNEVVDVRAILANVFDAMEAELDFTKEAANMERARASVGRFPHLEIPEVVAATPGVLVQSLAPGGSVARVDREELSPEHREAIARELAAFMGRGYFIDRFYHADPHPGNVFVTPDGPATLLDWGMVGRVDQQTSIRMLLLLMAVGQNDGHGLAKVWAEMGRSTPWTDLPAFCADMAALVPKLASASMAELNFGVAFSAVLEKAARRGIASAPTVGLIGKSLVNLEGSVRLLAPHLTFSDLFESEVHGIVLHVLREMISPQHTARRALESLLAYSMAGEQLRADPHGLADRALFPPPGPAHRGIPVPPVRPGGRQHALLACGALALWAVHRRASKLR
ncbi:ABC1 kinase family protein [Streptomyces rubradiris]|uniref:ATP/GTP-binding protein n=1 Tax=Streptomyces rubradiris TaxID=285531 RepID=A0ABQ3R9J7_STRRR|nr:AarF/UbiB family protein [Streptomyces rubradiris]GHH00075.1 ATP/GTP-binding protein [Streptomyces rubradiris]GHI52512.1 ATP/GTP-binding protein [Streptomyces rubradiris]